MKMRTTTILACLIFAALPARAQQTNLPEELAVTESIVLQEADELQTSAFARYSSLPDAKVLEWVGAFEYGLTDRWQVECEVPYVFRNPDDSHSVNGLGDIELGTRYAIRDFRTQPWALDVGLGVGLPTGDQTKELGEGRVSLEPRFTLSQWFGPVNAQLNGGWQHAVSNGGEEPKDEFTYNLALVYPVGQWFFAVEGDGTSTSRETKYYITPQIIWRPRRNLELLFAVPCGVTHAAGDYGFIAAVTFEFGGVTGRGKDDD
jgi:hypothetical protein